MQHRLYLCPTPSTASGPPPSRGRLIIWKYTFEVDDNFPNEVHLLFPLKLPHNTVVLQGAVTK